jgi:hypothetical protein
MTKRTLGLWVVAAVLLPWTAGGARGADAPCGYLGFHVEPLSILSPAQRKELGTDLDEGNVVAALIHGGPADGAGLKLGDLLMSLGGHDIPPLKTHDRYNPVHHQWRVAMRKLFASIPLGDVPAVVTRGGKTLTLTIHAVDQATMHRMEGGSDVRVPPPAQAGAPARMQLLFEKPAGGGDLPAGFIVDEGHWHLVEHEGAASLHGVLRQDLTVLPWAAVVATGPGRSYTDGHAQVRFKTLSGITDASGGVIWRAQDGRNYYLTRANALEDNFEIYIMRDGIRTDLAKVRVKLPAFNQWHVIDVWFHGSTFRATLDGANAVEAHDTTWSAGYCGLWTKADSVTVFDDFEVTPRT